MSDPLAVANAALKRFFGYEEFRPGQRDVVAAVLSGRDTLGVLPTGGGKSLCYQVPALVRPALTIVVSPLISLMQDQVDRLQRRGIAAAYLNSSLSASEASRCLQAAQRGLLRLLYLAPERLESTTLHRALAGRVSLLAVDEAHCISEWGHEFRPSFRRIARATAALRAPQTIALTATATPRVRTDIIGQLRLTDPHVVVGGFDRPNLHYVVRHCRSEREKDRVLLEELRATGAPAVVYAPTRAAVTRVTRHLRAARLDATAYHGGLPERVRAGAQDAFMRGRVRVIVATNAFGMGIDKPDVRLVVHHAMPGTLEAYYQEAGRAGRDGEPSRCVLLHATRDRVTHEWFIQGAIPEPETVRRVHAAMIALAKDGRVFSQPAVLLAACPGLDARQAASAMGVLVRADILEREAPHANGRAAADAWTPPGDWYRLTGTGIDTLDWDRLAARRRCELTKLAQVERYVTTRRCRRKALLAYFGEPSRHPCTGCDNCLHSAGEARGSRWWNRRTTSG